MSAVTSVVHHSGRGITAGRKNNKSCEQNNHMSFCSNPGSNQTEHIYNPLREYSLGASMPEKNVPMFFLFLWLQGTDVFAFLFVIAGYRDIFAFCGDGIPMFLLFFFCCFFSLSRNLGTNRARDNLLDPNLVPALNMPRL